MSAIFSLGVMTGTSCDGADGAALSFGKKDEGHFIGGGSAPFPEELRSRLREAQRGKLTIPETALLCRDYSLWMAGFCKNQIRKLRLPHQRTVLAIHGQTVWHQPPSRGELGYSVQLLDPALVAAKTGVTVTAAFRQPDLARGGHGAPLVPYYHWLRAKDLGMDPLMPFAVHNIGGIANVTCVTRQADRLFAFDSGPGNALMDLAVEALTRGRERMDRGGRIAKAELRNIDWKRIDALGRHPYFKQRPPKSTGRELFNESYLSKIPGRGALKVAYATALTAHTMAAAYRDFVLPKARDLNCVFLAGGGALNPTLLSWFSRELARLTRKEIPVLMLPDFFAPAQSLEAMAFARFGFEALRGGTISLSNITGAKEHSFGAGIFPGKNFSVISKALR